MDDKLLALHSMLLQSEVNGPGERLVIWTQGCTKACPGCFNPETWKFSRKNLRVPSELAEEVISSNPEGLTLTGGDPLEQPEALLDFLKALHNFSDPETLRADLFPRGIICFTGFVIEELSGAALECVDYLDLLIDGRFIEKLRYTSGLAGSSNQRFHFNSRDGRGESRISRDEVVFDQAVEIHVDDTDPSIIRITGFPSIDRKWLRSQGLFVETSDEDVV